MLIRKAFAWHEGRDAALGGEQRVVPEQHHRIGSDGQTAADAWLAGYDNKELEDAPPMTAGEYLKRFDQWGRAREVE